MYWLCGGLGFGSGFSVLYITMSAEQFGTNLRATTAISIPNVVRGILPLIILMHKGMTSLSGNYLAGAAITGIFILGMAYYATWHTKETYGKDLNFIGRLNKDPNPQLTPMTEKNLAFYHYL